MLIPVLHVDEVVWYELELRPNGEEIEVRVHALVRYSTADEHEVGIEIHRCRREV